MEINKILQSTIAIPIKSTMALFEFFKNRGTLLVITGFLIIITSIPLTKKLDLSDGANYVFLFFILVILSTLVIIYLDYDDSNYQDIIDEQDQSEKPKAPIAGKTYDSYSTDLNKIKIDYQTELLVKLTLKRLSSETNRLKKFGLVHLFFGVLITILGLAILSFTVFNIENKNTEQLVSYFFPRLSLVLLIEIFAYFFLRMYKQNFDEIKYFQNEITNIEQKAIGLVLCEKSSDDNLKIKSSSLLLSTDRNNIEKSNTDAQQNSLISEITNLLKAANILKEKN